MLAAFLQYLFSGLTVGATYALAALGFSIIYNASGVINFAQGEFIMLGGMSAAVLVTAGIPLPFAILLAVGIAGLAGLLVEKLAIEPARNAEVVTLIIITIGASLFIRGLVQVFLGKDTHSLPPFGGETPIAFLGLQNFISHLQSGTMTGLAVDGAQRSPLFPDIPTLAELGYRGNLTRVYFGLVAPAGTPQPIIDKIRADVLRIGSDPVFRKKHLIDRALEPILNTPEEFARFLVADRATSERVVKEAGLQPQ